MSDLSFIVLGLLAGAVCVLVLFLGYAAVMVKLDEWRH